jgi:hypothetical protein
MSSEESYSEKLAKELEELVLDESNNVRWDAIRDKYFKKMGDSHWHPDQSWTGSDRVVGDRYRTWHLLFNKGILSTKVEGNCLVLAGDMSAGPSLGSGPLYFTREEDAKGYVGLEYGRVMYEVLILKCPKVERAR